jgi:pimeloyl-ACP methyl ester carboxylesterase
MRCGRLSVPENRLKPGQRQIELNVVVVRATTSPAQPDPLFFIVGGPGGDATRTAPDFAQHFTPRNRDIVLVDQRGTKGSAFLYCQELDLPADALMPRFHAPAVEVCRDRLEQKADLTQYSTLAAVEDLNAVRIWLGYDRINLSGSSYGTRVVLEYLRRHGEHVRTAFLLGPVPPDFKRPLYYGRDGLRVLDRVFAACAQDAACARAFPNLKAKLEQVLGRLDREPAVVAMKHPSSKQATTLRLDRSTFAEILLVHLQSAADARRVPHIITRAAAGDFAPVLENAFDEQGQLTVRDLVEGMYLSVTCAEETMRIRPSDIGPQTPDFLGSTRLRRQMSACRSWPQSLLPDDFYEPVRSDVPTLIVTGELDPVTPASWAQSLMPHMSRARFIEIPEMGHGGNGTSNFASCLIDHLHVALWETADAAKVDTSCVATMKPPPFYIPEVGGLR